MADGPVQALRKFVEASAAEVRRLGTVDAALSHWRQSDDAKVCLSTLKHLARGLKDSATRFGLLLKAAPTAEALESMCADIYDSFQQLNSCVVLLGKAGLARPLRSKATSCLSKLYSAFAQLLQAGVDPAHQDISQLVGIVWTECDNIGKLQEENREAYNSAIRTWCRLLDDITREFSETLALPERREDEAQQDGNDAEEHKEDRPSAELAESEDADDQLGMGDEEVGYSSAEKVHVKRLLGIVKLCRIALKQSFKIQKSVLDDDHVAASSPVLLAWVTTIHDRMEALVRQSEDAAVALYPPLEAPAIVKDSIAIARQLHDFSALCLRVPIDEGESGNCEESGASDPSNPSIDTPAGSTGEAASSVVDESLASVLVKVQTKLAPLLR